MVSVMGIGMQTSTSCCGAFMIAVGMIGLFTTKDQEHDCYNDQGYKLICELTE